MMLNAGIVLERGAPVTGAQEHVWGSSLMPQRTLGRDPRTAQRA